MQKYCRCKQVGAKARHRTLGRTSSQLLDQQQLQRGLAGEQLKPRSTHRRAKGSLENLQMAEVFGVRLNPDGLTRVPPDQRHQSSPDVGQVQQLWRLAPTDHPPGELATPSPGSDLEVRQTDEQRLRRQHSSGAWPASS